MQKIKSRERGKKKIVILNVLILTASLITAFIILELVFRFVIPVGDAIFIGDEIIGHKHIPNKQGIFVIPEHVSRVSFNKEGFRDINHNLKNSDNTYRIAVLGDSFVDALEVDFEDSFPQILRKKIEDSDEKIEIFNFGMYYFSTAQEYLTYKNYAEKYKPDAVYLFVFANDPYDICLEDANNPTYYLDSESKEVKQREFQPSMYNKIEIFIAENSKTAVFLRKVYLKFLATIRQKKEFGAGKGLTSSDKVFLKEYDKQTEECWILFSYFMQKLKEECDNSGAELFVFIIPHPASIYEDSKKSFLESTEFNEFLFDFEKDQRTFERILNEKGIKFLNLKEIFTNKEERFYYEQDWHFNKKGHEVVADKILEKLINDSIIKKL